MKQSNYNYKDYDKALLKQKERYEKRVKSMMEKALYSCYFLTFTFSDKTLLETSQRTRERYIKEWLNQQATEYLLNCDYGDRNGREHYHAFIISRYKVINFNTPIRHNIFIDARKTTNTIYNIMANNKYNIEYLTAHAFKNTTKNTKIIYSRPHKENKINQAFKTACDNKLDAYRKSDKGKLNKEQFTAMLERDIKTYNEITKQRRELDELLLIADTNNN